MRIQNESKKHHYLPVFYLNGFTENGGFVVYDKLKKKLIKDQVPKNHFFVKNLNTLFHDGKKVLNYERNFDQTDKEASKLLKFICDPSFINEEQLLPIDRFKIIAFIQSLYWRSPFRDETFREMIKKEGLFNKYFGIKAGEENIIDKNVLEGITKDVINDPESLKTFKHVVPSTTGTEELWNLYSKWHFTKLTDPNARFLVGDDPFLINNPRPTATNIFGELIFPISGKHILRLSDNQPEFFDANHFLHINLGIFHNARRFVACSNENYLKEIIWRYELCEKNGLSGEILSELFGFMHWQANFTTYDEYRIAFHAKFGK